MQKIPLPTGIDDFKEIVKNYYYIDKTSLIEQVLENGSKVSLFTRPRRFGKSLNMSMLQSFFEIGTDLPYLITCIFQKIQTCVKNILENILSFLSV